MPTQCSRGLFGAIGLVGRFAACFNDGRAPGAGLAHHRDDGGAAGIRLPRCGVRHLSDA
jgi:hypothetical protein